MYETLLTLLSLSVSGTLLALVLTVCKPLFRKRLSRGWQYYIYLAVILRLLVPWTTDTNLVGGVFDLLNNRTSTQSSSHGAVTIQGELTASPNQESPSTQQGGLSPIAHLTPADRAAGSILIVWLGVSVTLFTRKVTLYQRASRAMRVGGQEIDGGQTLQIYEEICRELDVQRPPVLIYNQAAMAPMLIGILHPCIVLPESEVSLKDLGFILRHELAHYRRQDILYKWLVQLAVCLHWFNPVVYYLSREVSRNCELSCDETVMRPLDRDSQLAYGDTLLNAISSHIETRYPSSYPSLSLNENAELMKERLVAIMNLPKNHNLSRPLMVLITAVVLTGALMTGAYAANKPATVINGSSAVGKADRSLPDSLTQDLVPQGYALEFGSYSLRAGEQYTLSVSWKTGGESLDLSLTGAGKVSQDFTIKNGESVNLSVTKDGLYSFHSDANRASGTLTGFTVSFKRSDSAPKSGSVDTSSNAPLSVDQSQVTYDDSPYRWPELTHRVKNVSQKTIVSYELSLLAFDRSGNPLELYWDAYNVDKSGSYGNVGYGPGGVDYGIVVGIKPQSEKSYEFLTDYDVTLSPGQEGYMGGWHLFDGWWDQPNHIHKAQTILPCVKRVTFSDGTSWENPNYASWIETYQGKQLNQSSSSK